MASRPRALILPAVLTLVALAVLVSLGNWQVRRLAWKEDLIARATERPQGPVEALPAASDWASFDIEEGEYRPYRLTGRFLHEKEALVFTSLSDPRGTLEGPGYWVLTPFTLDSGGTVLVNRGFVPQGRERPENRGEVLPAGPLTLTGLLRPDDTRNFFTPDDKPGENLFFARSIPAIAAAKGIPAPVAPFSIDLLAAGTPPGGLPQAGETRFAFANRHFGYAITWYGLAAALLAVFASFAWSHRRGRPQQPRLTPPGEAP